jgi:hypothetical protein
MIRDVMMFGDVRSLQPCFAIKALLKHTRSRNPKPHFSFGVPILLQLIQ